MPTTTGAANRRQGGPAPQPADYDVKVLVDGRVVAVLGTIDATLTSREIMKMVLACLPDGTLTSCHRIQLRNAFWSLVVPVRGPAATVIADGVRLMHLDTRLDILRDRQRGAERDRTQLAPSAPRRRGARARGAGRPRGRRARTSSSSSSGDDGPPGHLGAAGGRSRHSRQQQAVIAW
jgi:hypothetical protein